MVVKKGSQFRQIFNLLKEGKSAQKIIAEGFPERTVYWAVAKTKEGKTPLANAQTGFDLHRHSINERYTHKCDDDRVSKVFENEIDTDEGVAYELRCVNCNKLLRAWFEKWTPDSKENYLKIKEGALATLAQSPLLQRATKTIGRRF